MKKPLVAYVSGVEKSPSGYATTFAFRRGTTGVAGFTQALTPAQMAKLVTVTQTGDPERLFGKPVLVRRWGRELTLDESMVADDPRISPEQRAFNLTSEWSMGGSVYREPYAFAFPEPLLARCVRGFLRSAGMGLAPQAFVLAPANIPRVESAAICDPVIGIQTDQKRGTEIRYLAPEWLAFIMARKMTYAPKAFLRLVEKQGITRVRAVIVPRKAMPPAGAQADIPNEVHHLIVHVDPNASAPGEPITNPLCNEAPESGEWQTITGNLAGHPDYYKPTLCGTQPPTIG